MKTDCLFRRLGCVLFLIIVSVQVCAAYPVSGKVSVTLEKTFDHGKRIDHKITASDRQHTVVMIFSQLRHAEGSDRIAESYLSYRPQVEEKSKPYDSDVMRVFVTHIMQSIHRTFGQDLKLVSLTASGFLNDATLQKKNLLAFSDHKPWHAYLNPKGSQQYSQLAAHEMVINRWKQKGVFDQVTGLFKTIGYTADLSGFEKLFVQRADQFGCYLQSDLKTIKPSDRYPFPGVVYFNLRKNSALSPSK